MGRRGRRRRLRAAPPPAAARRVPPHRPARPRPARASSSRSFAPTVVAHFGVYEPASRMSPASAIERTELCTIATLSAAARAGNLEYVVVRSGLEVYGPRHAHGVGARRGRHARAARRRTARSLLAGRRRSPRACALRHGVPVCALRYAPVVGLARAEPARPAAAAAGGAGARVRRSAVLAAAPRRRGRGDGRRDRAPLRRSAQHRRPRRGDARGRRCGSAVGCRCRCSARCGTRPRASSRSRARRSRRTSSSCCATAAPVRAAAPSTRSASPICVRRRRAARAVRVGRTSSRSRPAARRWHEHDRRSGDVDPAADTDWTSTTSRRRVAVARRCAAGSAAAIRSIRSGSIRSSPTLTAPSFSARRPRRVTGGEHVPATGGAVLVANRGFGVFEPAARRGLGAARRPAAGFRVIGAPDRAVRRWTVPPPGRDLRQRAAISRRACAPVISSRVPLAPTWLRTGAGHAAAAADAGDDAARRSIPVAVTPGGPFGTRVAPWRVRFGPVVTLDRSLRPRRPARRGAASPKRCATRSANSLEP